MPLEGHGMDCDCGCCDVEEEPRNQAQKKNVCPSCGKEMPERPDGHCRREVPHLWGKYATGRLKQVLEIRSAERRKS